ncbi:DUF6417 family protein [Streptomyces sp. NPDC057199]|uniref:DUF6417 family protein n=1 Tax=Streptomyces sp. NPDC057199 TaxID=3346047 RepID=UPI00363945B5
MNGPEAFSLRAESRTGTRTATFPGRSRPGRAFVRDRGGAGCVAQEDGPVSPGADRWAREIAARIPSES